MAIDNIPAHASHFGYLTIVRVVIILENTGFTGDYEWLFKKMAIPFFLFNLLL